MRVQLTDAGAALLNANQGPIQVSTYKLGSAYGYIPAGSDTNIHGSLVYSGAPSQYFIVNANVVKYSVLLDYNLGPFDFGEIGIFTSTGVLFALATGDELLHKIPISLQNGNSIRIDIYLSMVGQNYEMWLDYADTNSNFRMAVLNSVDNLPPVAQAAPNAYIISGATAGQSSFMAYTDRLGLWNFDCYAYSMQRSATIKAFDAQSVTIDNADYVDTIASAYFGEVIAEFSTGINYSICRYVSAVVKGTTQTVISFSNPLMTLPIVGDQIIFFARQQLSTTIPNLPIATSTSLGAIKVGTSLTITADGTLNVAPTAYPVTSVNGKTGDVQLTANDIPGLATVAKTGQYSDLLGAPPPYTLPIASTTTLGGVKISTSGNLSIAGDGTLDFGFQPTKSVNGFTPDGTGNITLNIPNAVIGLVTPTQIQNGEDVNNYKTTGLFFVMDADASSIANLPNSNGGGTLDIEPFTTTASGGDVIQRYTQASTMYLRRYTQSTNVWSTWVQIQTAASLPIATHNSVGVVQVGTGLNVTGQGLLSTQIQSINGKTDQALVLTASDVGAIPITALDAQGGVPVLDSGTNNPATDPYQYGRMRFWENTLGTWWNAGTWNAATNQLMQTGSTSYNANTSLQANGQQTIDISYNGTGRSSIANPDYQTVSGEGQVYRVGVAGTTNLDGTSQWDVGDLVVGIKGQWTKITVNFTNVVFSAGTF
jgi:hypothetical protein